MCCVFFRTAVKKKSKGKGKADLVNVRPERVTLLDRTVRIWFRIREIALFQCDEIRPWPPKEDIGRARQEKSRDQPRRQCALSAFNGRSQQKTIQSRRINQAKARYYKEKRCKTMGRLTEGFLREKKANSFSFWNNTLRITPLLRWRPCML